MLNCYTLFTYLLYCDCLTSAAVITQSLAADDLHQMQVDVDVQLRDSPC